MRGLLQYGHQSSTVCMHRVPMECRTPQWLIMTQQGRPLPPSRLCRFLLGTAELRAWILLLTASGILTGKAISISIIQRLVLEVSVSSLVSRPPQC
jgi:hypothetical protein